MMLEPTTREPHEMLLVGPRPLALEGFRLAHVTPSRLDPAQVAGMTAVLVDGGNPAEALQICRRLRQHASPAIYLAPILLLEAEAGSLPKAMIQAVDGVSGMANFATLYYQQFADRIGAIRQAMSKLVNGGQAQDVNLAIKFLRYLFVRMGNIQPVHDVTTLYGYHYPELDLFMGRPDDNIFEILDFLEGQRLLAGEFVDKIHLCGNCGASFLNFREACPHCHGANLHVDDLVHHFRCAHVAPMEDYLRKGKLHCPKCEQDLRQIGVDYDKPSAVYVCRDCGHNTQDPETSTLCYHCGTQSVPERLGQHTVKSYALTGLAENAAMYGLDNLFSTILESELDLLPLGMFKRFLTVEIERTKRYHLSRSSLVMLYVQDMDRIYMEAGPRAKEIFGEFGRILRAALRPSDVITAFNDSLFLVLATETPSEGAAGMAARVTERLDELIRSNFTRSVQIASGHAEVAGESDGDALIERLIHQKLP